VYSCSGLNGDIKVLESLTKLTTIHVFQNIGIYGDINTLVNHTEFRDLIMSMTNVSGDINSCANLHELRRLSFSTTNVIGDISLFANHTNFPYLYYINIPYTQVTGSVNLFANRPNLAHLFVNNTNKPGIY